MRKRQQGIVKKNKGRKPRTRAQRLHAGVLDCFQRECVQRSVSLATEPASASADALPLVATTGILSELERLSVFNASKTNLKAYIKNAVDMVCSFVKCAVISITLFDTDETKINYRYVTGNNGEFIDRSIIELEERYAKKMKQHRTCLNVKHLRNKTGVKAIALFPLLLHGRLLGVVSLLFREPVVLRKDVVAGIRICVTNLALMVQNVRLYSSIAGNHYNIIRALIVSLEARDRYTHGHSQRVTDYALKIARKMRCSKREIKILQEVAPLHDIGKIAIPDATLNKVERLTDEEFNEIKSHALKGSIMLDTLGFDRECVQLVRWHHEAYNGRGYPDRLAEKEIPLLARILCVADAYDAMTSDRPYRKKMSKEAARAEIRRCSGSQFCPDVVETFFSLRL